MTERPYKARSLSGAQAKVRHLQKMLNAESTARTLVIAERNRFRHERNVLAKLACDRPMFYSPLHVVEAKKLRDQIIEELSL